MPGTPTDVHDQDLIQPAWGNQVRDQTIQRFPNTGARDAALPNPAQGTFCVTTDTDTLWQALAGGTPAAWQRRPWVALIGYGISAGQVITQAYTAINGTSITFTPVSGHRYRMQGFANWLASAGGIMNMGIFSAAGGAALPPGDYGINIGAGIYASFPVAGWWTAPSAAPVTYQLQAKVSAGNIQLNNSALFEVFDWGLP